MPDIELCKQIVRQPGFAYTLDAEQMNSIGYTPDVPGWPNYVAIVRQAAAVLREAGLDPTRPDFGEG